MSDLVHMLSADFNGDPHPDVLLVVRPAGVAFTDPSLTPGVSVIRVAHVGELRAGVD